jgi:hypothetical protein
MRHDPTHTEILCYKDGFFYWACEDCPHIEPATQGQFKEPEETRQFRLRLEAA